MTLPTAAKPSSESPRETRSTVVVSTRVVSLRTPGPKRRASEAASLAGGAAGPWVASRRSASPAITSELVPDAEAQHLVLADATRVADQLVVALERGVPGGLVREPERRDTARERGVAGDARGHIRVGVVALVAHEGIELLGRTGREGVQQVVGALDVPARDAAGHGRAVARVDRPGVLDADVRHHGAKAHGALVVARVGRHERDRGVEGTAAEHAVGGGAAPVPERAAQLQPRPRPLEPPGQRRVRERGVLPLLASLPDPFPSGKPLGSQPFHKVHPIAETPSGNGPRGTDAYLAPVRRQHVVVDPRSGYAVREGRLVRLVDDPDRHEHAPRSQRE